MAKHWRWARWIVGLLVGAGIARSLIRNWAVIVGADIALEPIPWLVVASLLPIWMGYAALVDAWRRLLHGWRQPLLPPREATRIWILSNLGRYIPGKIWTITGMAVLARKVGVAPWASTGSAVLQQIIAVASGTIIVALAGVAGLSLPGVPWMSLGGLLLVALLGVWAVTSPRLSASILRRVDPGADPAAPPGPVVGWALAANLMAWFAYGTSLWLLSAGLFPSAPPNLLGLTGAWAAAYLAGLLSPVPGGIGIREGVLFELLRGGPLGPGAALALAGATRITMTVAELVVALPFLATRSRSSTANDT